MARSFSYPQTATEDVVDDYHGVKVADPYRWLEDLDSPRTAAWVESQNTVTFAYLRSLELQPKIEALLTRLWNYERWSLPHHEGGRYFVSRNDGLQNQSVLYWMPALDAEPTLLLDPNTLSNDGTVALSGTSISHDGKRLAYGLSSAGSDWQTWRVRDIETGQDTSDVLEWVKFSGASWTQDNQGFFYSRYDRPKKGEEMEAANYYHKLYYHRLGEDQFRDILIYQRRDQKDWNFSGRVTEDGKWLVIDSSVGTDPRSRIFVAEVTKVTALAKKAQRLKEPPPLPQSAVVPLLDAFDARWDFVGNDGDQFYFFTDKDAPRGRLVAIDRKKPQAGPREIVAQSDDTLTSIQYVGGRFVANYLHDAASHVLVFDKTGTLERTVELPGIGSASGFGGQQARSETFFSFANFVQPGTIHRYDVATGERSVFRQPKLAFDPNKYVTEQVFIPSKDGTKVPMFLVYKKGLVRDGSNPTYLYGYGGFNISLTPSFSPANIAWLEMGGVYAQPNLRGGGEYGEPWHQAGTKLSKQNVFDDFIASAEWLIDQKITRPDRLAIGGRSNGGLLVGAALTQRPDLFGAALAGVGVLDMLRFHKFTIGWAWTSDYGSSDDSAQFKALYAYSPLHNVRPGTAYPATLVYTADHDDRVVPSHSFKFAAALQAAQSGSAPTLIRIDVRAGHGAGKPTKKTIEEWADLWAFAIDNLRVSPDPEAFR